MGSNSVSRLLKKRNTCGEIELDKFEKLKETSLVYGTNAECWFRFDDARILFKFYENNLEAYGEVLYSKVAQKYGINCAEYDFASYGGESGTISYDVAFGSDTIAIDGLTMVTRYNNNNLPDIITKRSNNIEVISMLNKKYNNYEELTKLFEMRYPDDVESLQKELIEIFILDVLFDHVDKNLWNIMVVTDLYGNNAHLVSIDSSHIACLYRGYEYIKRAVSSLLSSDGTITIEDYLQGGVYGYDVDVKDRDYNPCKDLIEFYYNCDETQRDMIVKLVKDINIDECLEEIRKIYKVEPIIETWVSAVVNSRKSFLLKKFYHINDNYKEEHGKKNFNLRILKKNKSNK